MTGEEVREIRKKNNLSQEEFGKSVGLSKSGISNIESGVRKVNKRLQLLIEQTFLDNSEYGEREIDLSSIPTYVLLGEIERRCIK